MRRRSAIVIDTREKKPLDFPGRRTVRGALKAGDYSLRGYTSTLVVERKSVGDFYSWLGDRKRRDKQLAKLLAVRYRCLVVEGRMTDGSVHSSITPFAAAAASSLMVCRGLPIIFADNRGFASYFIEHFLDNAKLLVDTL